MRARYIHAISRLALLCMFVATAARVEAQPCNGGDSCGCGSCLSQTPCLEMERGWSLYWHNPCNCTDEPCLPNSCATSSAPLIYAGVELVPLLRDERDGGDYQVNGTTGDSVLRESLFRSEFDAGGRALLGVTLGDWYRLEASYLGSYDWDDRLVVRNTDANGQGGNGNLFSPFSDFGDPAGISGFDFNNFASIQFVSEMESVELNLRRRLRFPDRQNYLRDSPFYPQGSAPFLKHRAEASCLVGIRYMNIDERFNYFTQSDVPAGGSNNSVDIATGNQMIGAQIGLLSQFLVHRRSWIDVEIKGGIYQNRVSVDSSYINTDTAGTVLSSSTSSDAKDQTAWLGELSVIYNHQFARSLTCRVGYNAIWATQLALASRNFTDNLDRLPLGPALVGHDGDIVYHGPSIGLVWAH